MFYLPNYSIDELELFSRIRTQNNYHILDLQSAFDVPKSKLAEK